MADQAGRSSQDLKQGFELQRAGNVAEAAAVYQAVVAREPGNADALHLLGALKAQTGAPAEGEQLIAAALLLAPNSALIWLNHGNALVELKRSADAVESFRRATELAPDMVPAHYCLCAHLIASERPEEALQAMETALLRMPGHHLLLTGKANALAALERPVEALGLFDAAVAAAPRNVDAICGMGQTLMALLRPQEAKEQFDNALKLVPGHLDSILGRCQALGALGDYEEASAILGKVLAIMPTHAMAHYVRGTILLRQADPVAAIASLRTAVELAPRLVDAIYLLADTLMTRGRFVEAAEEYRKVLARHPDNAFAQAGLAAASMYCCDWPTLRDLVPRLEASVRAGKPGVNPFWILSFIDDPELHHACARSFARRNYPEPVHALPPRSARAGRRLRVGYLSSDFRRHAMAYQMVELFEHHNRDKFEVIGFSGGTDDRSAIRVRIFKALDKVVEVTGQPSERVARIIREHEIDIAVDLSGNTYGTMLGALAWRPAPVQATYLGFPGTTGAAFMDYVIADDTVAPLHEAHLFSEKIVHLPGCYQVSDSQRKPAALTPTRASAGLPETAFVFANFNTSYKLSEPIFEVWMRILAAVPGSVLWLVRGNEVMTRNLRGAAAAHGIDPGRLVFCDVVESDLHIARHRLADLYLDTLPYNSHGTGSFALWAGLPMLTCKGPTFAGRVAASLLNGVGMPELVTESIADYERLAVALAADLPRLGGLRSRLERQRMRAPLFDTRLFQRHIEAAYQTMADIAARGEPPRHFAVPPLHL